MLFGLLMAPQTSYAETSHALGWIDGVAAFVEILFPDVRGEVGERAGPGTLLSWPIPVEVLEKDDRRATLEVFAEPQWRLDNDDLRFAAGGRGNWNVFELDDERNRAGFFVEAGGVYDDFPAVHPRNVARDLARVVRQRPHAAAGTPRFIDALVARVGPPGVLVWSHESPRAPGVGSRGVELPVAAPIAGGFPCTRRPLSGLTYQSQRERRRR
jgi:hypothetical protein